MNLNIADNASTSDIYRAVMENTIQECLVEIPLYHLKRFHRTLLDGLKFNKIFIPADNDSAQDENKKHDNKNLTFDTSNFSGYRYSCFQNASKAGETVKVYGFDPTSKCFRHAIDHFGNDCCANMGGFWSALAEKARTDDLSFIHSMVAKGALRNTNVQTTSYTELDIDAGLYTYAYPAYASLFFHTPTFVKSVATKFEFEKEKCTYGDKRIESTLLKLSPKSEFNTRAPAEYDINVKKEYCVKGWAKFLSLGITSAFDQEKTLTFSSDQVTVDFECAPCHRFKIKQKPNINITMKAANEFLSLEEKMLQCEDQLGMTSEINKLEYYNKAAVEEDDEEEDDKEDDGEKDDGEKDDDKEYDGEKNDDEEEDDEEDDDEEDDVDEDDDEEDDDEEDNEAGQELIYALKKCVNDTKEGLNLKNIKERKSGANCWTLTVVVNGTRKVLNAFIKKGVEKEIETLVLEITTRKEAFSHIDTALRKTASIKREIILNPPTGNPSDINNLGSHAFEEIVNARVLAKAAELGIPLKFIEGDGIGHYVNPSGQTVKTPEFVDAIFHNEATGESISVQYKFSHTESYLNDLKTQWQVKWQNEDLSYIELVAPKGATQSGDFKDTIQIGKINVNTPTHQEVVDWINVNRVKLTDMAKEYQRLVNPERDLKRFKKKKKRIMSMKQERDEAKHPEGKKGLSQTIEKMEKECSRLKKNIKQLIKNKQESNKRIEELIKQTGRNPIPGMDDELSKQNAAKLTLQQKEKKIQQITDAQKEFIYNIKITLILSAATEFLCSMDRELTLYSTGKITLREVAVNVSKSTGTTALIQTGAFLAHAGILHGLTKMALHESSTLSSLGCYGSLALDPALVIIGITTQSAQIYSQYNIDKKLSPAFANKRILLDVARMAGVTIRTIGSFTAVPACIASGPVGLVVGGVLYIAIGYGDYKLGNYLNFEEESRKLQESKDSEESEECNR